MLDNFQTKLFKNRVDAFNKLKEILPIKQMLNEDWVIIAISSGGVPIANKIANITNSKMDFLFTEGIPCPNNKDCIIAKVSETEDIVINKNLADFFEIKLDYIYGEASRQHEEKIIKYTYQYRKGDIIKPLDDKNVLLVDDGIESGLTAMTCIKTVAKLNAKRVDLCVPVMPLSLSTHLEKIIDELYVIHKLNHFVNTKIYYEELEDLSSQDILKIIEESKK